MKILITGGSRGIGKAIADLCIKNGSHVIAVNREKTEYQTQQGVTVWEYDLSKVNDVQELCLRIESEKIDVLINNAGGGHPSDFFDLGIDQIENELQLNLITPILLIKSVLPNMIKNEFGRIINISSISGLVGTPYLFSYSAAKAGLNSITQSISRYIRKANITINTICPGGIDTHLGNKGRIEISKLLGEEAPVYEERIIKAMNTDGLISCEEVAEVVYFLVKMKTSSINGQTINICGTNIL